MAWLSGFNNRTEIIIDKDQIDTTLSGFPTPVYLSASSGQDNDDVSFIFDELITVSGTKKIAVTESDGETQCYVEIERWDWVNEKAWLHVKVPTIVSGTDTVLYFYYDSTQSDNTSYVGDVGSTPGKAVWDSNFKAVWHMQGDPTGTDTILDSTSNNNNGNPRYMASEDLIDGKFGKALDFDGLNDRVEIVNNSSVEDIDPITLETIAKSTNTSEDHIFSKASGTVTGYNLGMYTTIIFRRQWSTSFATWTAGSINTATWYSIAVTYDGGDTSNDPSMYKDGISQNVTRVSAPTGILSSDATHPIRIGGQGSNEFLGSIDEVRLSDIIRPPEWVKATHVGLFDNLLTFGSNIIFTFSDPIPIQSSVVYGTTQQLSLTTTISGNAPSYIYDAVFYDGTTTLQIGSTVSGIQSAEPASVYMDTPSGTNYSWYMEVTSSGQNDTSNVYSFTNRFLCAGNVCVNSSPASGIPVRLYRRSTGQLIGSTTSAGVSGTFEIESIYNEDHYVVALYTESGTNALIYDYIRP